MGEEARNEARVSDSSGREVRTFTDRREAGDSYLGKGIGQESCEMLLSSENLGESCAAGAGMDTVRRRRRVRLARWRRVGGGS
jgi:hypothetical protein